MLVCVRVCKYIYVCMFKKRKYVKDKKMDNKLIYVLYTIKLLVENFGQCQIGNNKSRFNKSTQSFRAYNCYNVFIKLWEPV